LRHHGLILVTVFVVAALATSGQTQQATRPAAGPEATAREFYAWYLHRLNKEDYDPLKNRTMALKYLTPEFLRRIPGLEKALEADVIVCSQDPDPDWEKNFKVEPANSQGARATIVLALSGNQPDTIKHKVTIKRTRAGWRIDGVDCGG